MALRDCAQADAIIVNHVDPNKQTPLHASALLGRVDLCEVLLMHGADVTLVDNNGSTALHAAVFGGHARCLAYLLDHNGDVVIDEQNKEGNTALHLAAIHNRCAPLSCGA
jgi:ankyrin